MRKLNIFPHFKVQMPTYVTLYHYIIKELSTYQLSHQFYTVSALINNGQKYLQVFNLQTSLGIKNHQNYITLYTVRFQA